MLNTPLEPIPSVRHTEGLRDFDRAVGRVAEPREVLQLAADAIVALRLFQRVVISLHDDQGNLGPIGYAGIPRELIEEAKRAPRVRKDVREAILQPRLLIGESYFVPSEAGIAIHDEPRHVPSSGSPFEAEGWRAGDELFTPLCRADGSVLGFCSVDQPFDGSRPTPTSLQPLEDVVFRAAARIDLLDTRGQLDVLRSRWERRLEQTGDFLYEYDIGSNRFAAVSSAATLFTGIVHSEITGLSLDEWVRRFVHPEDRERLRSLRLSPPAASISGRQCAS
jgi:PAS domain-containing protein